MIVHLQPFTDPSSPLCQVTDWGTPDGALVILNFLLKTDVRASVLPLPEDGTVAWSTYGPQAERHVISGMSRNSDTYRYGFGREFPE